MFDSLSPKLLSDLERPFTGIINNLLNVSPVFIKFPDSRHDFKFSVSLLQGVVITPDMDLCILCSSNKGGASNRTT